MADSTQDFTRKILVDVEIKSEQVKKDIPVLADLLGKYIAELGTLKAAQKDLSASGDINSKTYRDNTRDIVETTQAIRQLKGDIREANKYIDNAAKAINAETGSIQQNRAVLSLVTSDYVKLGQAEGQTDQATVKLAVDVNNLTDRLKDQEKAIGQTYRNVGNYTDSINKSALANGKGSQGLQTFNAGVQEVRKGIGFLPQLVTGATAQLGTLGSVGTTAFTALRTSVNGFNTVIKDHRALQEISTLADLAAIQAENDLIAATLANAKAQEAAAAGLITKTEAEAAAVAMEEADTVATLALAEATTASTAATTAGAVALDLFKVALASTGIGLLIIALGTLIAYFTDTNEGAKKLQVVFAEIGALVDTIVKQIAPLGKAIFDVFSNSAGPIRLVAGLLGQAVLPLATIVKLIGDIKNGEFKQAFIDAGEAVKQFGTNMKNVVVGAVETTVDLAKAVGKASGEININSDEIKKNAKAAGELMVQRQGLTKVERLWSEEKTKQQGILDLLKLKIRDLSTTEGQRIQAAKDAKGISDLIYANDLKNANQNLKIIQGQQALKSKVDYQAITDAKNRVQQLTNAHNSEIQSIQNRQSRVESLQNKHDQSRQKAYDAAELIREQSEARILQNIYEEYGDRAVAANEAYQSELNKLKGFLTEKKITQREYNSVELQLKKEHESNIAKIIKDFQEKDYQTYIQASNGLRNAQIANIEDNTKRTIAGLNERALEEGQALTANNLQHTKNIESLNAEIAHLDGAEKAEAQARRENEFVLIQLNEEKRIALEKKTAADILQVKRKAANDNASAEDQANVLKSKRGTNIFSDGGVQAAEIKATTDKYNWEISEAARAGQSTVLLEQQKIDAIKAINDQYRNQKIEYAYQAETQIQQFAVDIFTQGIQQTEQAAIASAEARKSAELNNTSLTKTQQALIQAKYDKEEKKIKLKAFKDNQKLQIANAIISGAVGVVKNIAEYGFYAAIPANILTIALTALEVAKIGSQKPAFATGGQFVSDGRGAALPGYSTRDNVNATLRDGEGVVVSEAMRVPWARNTISSINEQFGGRSFSVPGNYGLSMPAFASGGQFTDGGNANRYYSQPIINSGELANSIAYQLINNMPAIMVDVKDINTQQGILAQTLDRVNL